MSRSAGGDQREQLKTERQRLVSTQDLSEWPISREVTVWYQNPQCIDHCRVFRDTTSHRESKRILFEFFCIDFEIVQTQIPPSCFDFSLRPILCISGSSCITASVQAVAEWLRQVTAELTTTGSGSTDGRWLAGSLT
ncbi:unnamed protein product [Larinioides sclopetarius]|uniref:Uncharacterized protein n=1 Tax=Larinioides sclopetarius TaxID=280406 RepID=A0AAV1ZIE0_9ARAC